MNKNVLKIAFGLAIFVAVIEILFIYFIPLGVVTIVGAATLNKYSKKSGEKFEKELDKFFIWSVILAFTSVVPGILYLLYYISYTRKQLKNFDK